MASSIIDFDKIMVEIPMDRREQIRSCLGPSERKRNKYFYDGDHPVVLEGEVLRFKRDPLVEYLYQWLDFRTMTSSMPYPLRRDICRRIGYSLCGFDELTWIWTLEENRYWEESMDEDGASSDS